MPTYRVVLNGVLAGLDPCQVAPRLAVMCKIPVEGAMALLANPSMVIKGALDQQTATTYQAALRAVGCKARIEEDAGAGRPASSPTSPPAGKQGRTALSALGLRQHAEELGRRAKSALLAVIGSAQQIATRAGGRLKTADNAVGGFHAPLPTRWQEAFSAISTKIRSGARTLAAPSKAKRSLRAHSLVIASVFVTTVAVAAFFASSGSSTEAPCPQGTQATDSMNCIGQVDFPNGEKYVGEVREGQPNGEGTYTWANGAKYVGQWTNGQRNGRGMYLWPNGEKYVGEFRNNKKHGQGTLIYANGRKYVGEFKDGNPVSDAARQQSPAAERQGEARKVEVKSEVAQ